jgi:hypothetical protein
VFTWSRNSAKKVDNHRTPDILNPVMTYFWLIENLIKEYARHHRADGTTLDAFFKELRGIVDAELDITPLKERMEDYDLDNSWNDDAGA